MSPDNKFYADEIDATLVEVRYYMQALSMSGAPAMPNDSLSKSIFWLTGHLVRPGEYQDPIQLVPVHMKDLVEDASRFQSGHLIPLDRGGRHVPNNTFLMLKRSNALQGNLTLDELLSFMKAILERHQQVEN